MLWSLSWQGVLSRPRGEHRELLEARDDFLVDGVARLGPVHGEHPFPACVVLQQWHGLSPVHVQAVIDDGFGIV